LVPQSVSTTKGISVPKEVIIQYIE
jgi:hypothetical protein